MVARRIADVMTKRVVTVDASAPAVEAARRMKDEDIGDVVVMEGDRVSGIVTDRDIVVRAVAEGRDPETVRVAEISSGDLATVTPEESVGKAVRLMSDLAIRRLPVVKDGKPVGFVTIGDLAIEQDPKSALADISAAPAND